MLTEWELYWITRLDYINNFCLFFLIIAFAALIVIGLANGKECNIKIIVMITLIALFFTVGFVFIPNSRDYVVIKVIPKIVNNEKVQQIPDKFLDMVNSKLGVS